MPPLVRNMAGTYSLRFELHLRAGFQPHEVCRQRLRLAIRNAPTVKRRRRKARSCRRDRKGGVRGEPGRDTAQRLWPPGASAIDPEPAPSRLRRAPLEPADPNGPRACPCRLRARAHEITRGDWRIEAFRDAAGPLSKASTTEGLPSDRCPAPTRSATPSSSIS